MARRAPPPSDPTNRLPWIILGLGLLLILGASAVFFLSNPRTTNVEVTLGAEATATARALQAQAGRAVGGTPAAGVAGALTPPVLATPTPRATSTPIPVAIPSPTPAPTVVAPAAAPTRPPTPPPGPAAQPTQPPAQPTAPAPAQPRPTAPGAAPQPAGAAPTQPSAPAPTAAPAQPAATQPPAAAQPPTPTPFAGQVSAAGGAGNTRQDLDRAYGNPVGETPTSKLVVYRKERTEYRVGFAGEPQRAAFLVQVLPQDSNLPFEETTRLSRQLMPRDAQPRAQRPEGNDRYVVERFTSPILAQALPEEAFGNAQPGDFLVLHLKNARGAIEMIVITPGDDVEAAIQRARQ